MILVLVGLGILIGVYEMWTHIRIRDIKMDVDNFPTVEEMAIAVMNAKISLNKLPVEMQEAIKNTNVGAEMGPNMPPQASAVSKGSKNSYFG